MARLEDEIKQKQFVDEFQKMAVNIIYTGNWLFALNARALKSVGLSPQQYNILRILRGQHPQPVSVTLITERMLDKMSNASRLVEKLREKGLLVRSTNSSDRRQVDVCITEKGLELLETANPLIQTNLQLLKGLTTKEAQLLNELLDKLRG